MNKTLKDGIVLCIIGLVIYGLYSWCSVSEDGLCTQQGGLMVHAKDVVGYQIDLGINTTVDCHKYDGWCFVEGEVRPVSITKTGSCDVGDGDCFHPDFFEDRCLLPVND